MARIANSAAVDDFAAAVPIARESGARVDVAGRVVRDTTPIQEEP